MNMRVTSNPVDLAGHFGVRIGEGVLPFVRPTPATAAPATARDAYKTAGRVPEAIRRVLVEYSEFISTRLVDPQIMPGERRALTNLHGVLRNPAMLAERFPYYKDMGDDVGRAFGAHLDLGRKLSVQLADNPRSVDMWNLYARSLFANDRIAQAGVPRLTRMADRFDCVDEVNRFISAFRRARCWDALPAAIANAHPHPLPPGGAAATAPRGVARVMEGTAAKAIHFVRAVAPTRGVGVAVGLGCAVLALYYGSAEYLNAGVRSTTIS